MTIPPLGFGDIVPLAAGNGAAAIPVPLPDDRNVSCCQSLVCNITAYVLKVMRSFVDVAARKHLFYEFSLFITTARTQCFPSCFKGKWWTKINDDITLGANPLKSKGHVEALIAEGHRAVLSMLEEVETQPCLVGVPATAQDWREARITFLNLPNTDFTALSNNILDEGVAFLHAQITLGKKVYVHCNAGVGRGPTVVILYLIIHQNMSLEMAINAVYTKRWIYTRVVKPCLEAYLARTPVSSTVSVRSPLAALVPP